MKSTLTFLSVLLLVIMHTTLQAQNSKDNKWIKNWTNFEPNNTNYPEAEEKLATIIADDLYLNNDTTYLLSGNVYITGGATLTIEQGTVIRCDHENPATLIITKGSKLIAPGSEAYPIVFTSTKAAKSRNSGDWGGIIIAGSGKVNTVSGNGMIDGDFNPQYSIYGGANHYEQTAVLRYVRIEFAGHKAKGNMSLNGLSLYALGAASIVDNVMVSYSGQDSFNIHGGNTNISNLVSLKAEDDDFDISEGFKSDMNNILAVRHPFITSPRGSYAIEIDGYDKDKGYKSTVSDITITNATLVNLTNKRNYKHTNAAIAASNGAIIYLNNSKISGFSDVVKFDKSYTSLALIENAFQMDNSFFNIHGSGVQVTSQIQTNMTNILKYNRFTDTFVDVSDIFTDPNNKVLPKFGLKKAMNNYMVMQ